MKFLVKMGSKNKSSMRTVWQDFQTAALQVTWLETKFLNLTLHTNLGG